jgi:ribosome-binding protein aMBF1 (putative translation factor)
MNIRKFWDRVNDEIKKRGLSRKNFAESINIPYDTFKSWYYYNRSVEVETAYEIAKALDVTLEYLITGHDRKR